MIENSIFIDPLGKEIKENDHIVFALHIGQSKTQLIFGQLVSFRIGLDASNNKTDIADILITQPIDSAYYDPDSVEDGYMPVKDGTTVSVANYKTGLYLVQKTP